MSLSKEVLGLTERAPNLKKGSARSPSKDKLKKSARVAGKKLGVKVESDDGWEFDRNAGCWWMGDWEDPDGSVVEEDDGFNYYTKGARYPSGKVTFDDAKNCMVDNGDDDHEDEDLVRDFALEMAKDLASE